MSAEKAPHHLRTPIDPLIRTIASQFGKRAIEIERFLKFLVVGTLGTLVDFLTFNLLLATFLPPTNADGTSNSINVALASAIAFISATLHNFTWNRYWTYPDSRSQALSQQLWRFTLINLIGLSSRSVWVAIAHRPIGEWLLPLLGPTSIFAGLSFEEASARLGSNVSMAIGIAFILFWNFFANRYWTYGDVAGSGRDAPHHH